ncbi:hypothetical protein ACS0TY_016034 [Phlomoides rotata]
MEAEKECTTPRNPIPAALVCPPPPWKKNGRRTKQEPPSNGYFQSPELEKFFRNGQSGETWLSINSS